MEQRKFREKVGLLGKLAPGEKKLDGRTFYLDRVKKRSTTLLLEVITLFGGKVESFLHKDVSFVVTGCLEEQEQRESDSKAKTGGEATPSKQRESALKQDRQKQGTLRPALNACGSRGKALLEKAILNNERLQGSSVLTNARSWGVKILYADDVLFYLRQLSQESLDTKSKKSEVYTKQSPNAVKAAPLRSPYLKVEDSSRKYKPLHMQSMSFPSVYYSGRYSPFECPPPPRFDKWTEKEEKKNIENPKATVSTEDKCQTPFSCNPSPWRPRKDAAYCECCRQTYNNQEEHLQSDQHRAFVMDSSNYSVVDQLVAGMAPGFDPDPPPEPEELKQQTSPNYDACELEPLTDLETEDAVKKLKESNFSSDKILMSDTVSLSPASPPPKNQHPTANQSIVIPAITPEVDVKPLSPAMPVLEKIPPDPPLFEPHHDIKPLSPCPVTVCPNPDPFPPVLSPQVPDLHSHSSYLEAPILSPQQFTSQESKHEPLVQTDNQLSVSQSVPVAAHHSVDDVGTAATLSENSQAQLKVCYNICERRSRSLPRHTTTVLNPKKRCRSASPECSTSKRRRTNEFGVYEDTKHGQKSEITKDMYVLFESASCKILQSSPKPVRTLSSYRTMEYQDSAHLTLGSFTVPQMNIVAQWPPYLKPPLPSAPVPVPGDKCPNAFSSQNSECSNSHSTSVCIESALIPDVAALASDDSDSDWDCELLSRLGAPARSTPTSNEPNGELDKDLLHQPCPWMHDSSYESRLHNVLQPTAQPIVVDSSAFSRTVVQIVEVQH